MKCPHCGAEVTGRFCSFCGSELPQPANSPRESGNKIYNETVTHNITNNYYYAQLPQIPERAVQQRQIQQVEEPKYVSVQRPVMSPAVSSKSKDAAFLLCWFFGIFGAHLFYTERVWKGILYLFTGGLFGIGACIVLIVIASNNFTDSKGLPLVGTTVWSKRLIGALFLLIAWGLRYSSSSTVSMYILLIFGIILIFLSFRE
ncbi:MAG: TM2 domain-containing protein [Anaerolineaceae bacterium]|nr:TM2 domain-containing protein [Anaerolineaceae bacterium]